MLHGTPLWNPTAFVVCAVTVHYFHHMRCQVGGGGTLGIFGWGCAAGTLEPLSYTTKLVQVNFATLY